MSQFRLAATCAAFAASLVFASVGGAASIPVTNHSFEDDVNNAAPGGQTFIVGVPTGWTISPGSVASHYGVLENGAFDLVMPVTDGVQTGYINNSSTNDHFLFQNTGVAFLSGETYTLDVDVIRRPDHDGLASYTDTPWFVAFGMDTDADSVPDVRLGEIAGVETVSGAYAQQTIFNATAAEAGSDVYIMLGNPFATRTSLHSQAHFDNVRLDTTSASIFLDLQIDTTTGGVVITNGTGGPIDINAYEILSPGASLDPTDGTGWSSLQDQNLVSFPAGNGTGNGWEEGGGVSTSDLTETYLSDDSTVADAASISLGLAYDTGVDAQDVVFNYREGTSLIGGTVNYVASLLGDMNGDGAVDMSDVNPFVQALTNRALYDAQGFPVNFPDIIGDVNEDGSFNLGDVAAFKLAVNPPGTASASAVPEPSSLVLLGILGIAISFCRRFCNV